MLKLDSLRLWHDKERGGKILAFDDYQVASQ